MILHGIEYALSSDAEAFECISEFLELLSRSSGYFVGVLNDRYLRNKRSFKFRKAQRIKVFYSLGSFYNAIQLACVSHGHMSVAFVLDDQDVFLERFLALGMYQRQGAFQARDQNRSPLNRVQLRTWESLLRTPPFSTASKILSFAHDAESLYDIHVEH
jgi:hypothetical protein